MANASFGCKWMLSAKYLAMHHHFPPPTKVLKATKFSASGGGCIKGAAHENFGMTHTAMSISRTAMVPGMTKTLFMASSMGSHPSLGAGRLAGKSSSTPAGSNCKPMCSTRWPFFHLWRFLAFSLNPMLSSKFVVSLRAPSMIVAALSAVSATAFNDRSSAYAHFLMASPAFCSLPTFAFHGLTRSARTRFDTGSPGRIPAVGAIGFARSPHTWHILGASHDALSSRTTGSGVPPNLKDSAAGS